MLPLQPLSFPQVDGALSVWCALFALTRSGGPVRPGSQSELLSSWHRSLFSTVLAFNYSGIHLPGWCSEYRLQVESAAFKGFRLKAVLQTLPWHHTLICTLL